MNTDQNCIFCKIVAGDIPAHTVYKDDTFIAFLDIHPQAPGHIQIIPREHHQWVWDVPNVGEYFEVTAKLAKALRAAYGVDLIRSQVYGDEIAHAHVWLWPHIDKDGTETDFESHAKKIKAALGS